MTSVDIFTKFAAAINRHDIEALTALMTQDHLFVDSVGQQVQGIAPMEAGWRRYIAMCPDYWIRTDTVVADDNVVLAVGEAGGTIDGVPWCIPAAWKTVVGDGKVTEWRVFADDKPVYEILAKRR